MNLQGPLNYKTLINMWLQSRLTFKRKGGKTCLCA